MTDSAAEAPIPKGTLVTWALNLATTIALAVAGHLASELTSRIEHLSTQVVSMQSQVAVLNERVDRATSLEVRVLGNVSNLAAQQVEINALKDRLRALEDRRQ